MQDESTPTVPATESPVLITGFAPFSEKVTAVSGVRGLAAVYVVIFHAILFTGVAGWEFFRYGRFAVDVFVVISGFGLMLSVLRNGKRLRGGLIGYCRRRIIRFIPPYYAGLLLSLALAYFFLGSKTGAYWDVVLPLTWKSVLDHALLIHNFTSPALINNAYWYMAVEAQLYLLFPLLVFLWRRIGSVALLVLTFVLSVYLLFWSGIPVFAEHLSAPPYYVVLFLLGMIAASVVVNPSGGFFGRESKAWPALSLVGSLGVLAAIRWIQWGTPLWYIVSDPLAGLACMGVLITVGGPGRSVLRRILELPLFLFLGSVSYSLFLIHAPLLELGRRSVVAVLGLNAESSFLFLVLLGVPVITLLSYGFHLLFERPFQRLTDGKKQSAPVAVPSQTVATT